MRKLIRRERSDWDRRTVMVSITAEGTALVNEIAEPLRACHAKQLGHLSAGDLASFIDVLKKARQPHETNKQSVD